MSFKLDIVIPTKNRINKLIQCLGSIHQSLKLCKEYDVWVYVYYDNEVEYLRDREGLGEYLWIFPRLLNKPYKASEFWNDHIKKTEADAIMYLNDDVILEIECIKNSIESLIIHYPDLDGVIGIYQENIPNNQACPSAFGVIGKKFFNRFPDKKVFCEDYNRFYLDSELFLYSKREQKFFFDSTCRLKHLHPAFDSKQEDSTHFDVRTHLKKDKEMFILRQTKGYLWGKDFNLV